MSNTEVLGNERSLDPWGNELKVEGETLERYPFHTNFIIRCSKFNIRHSKEIMNTEVLGNERSLNPWGNELKVEGETLERYPFQTNFIIRCSKFNIRHSKDIMNSEFRISNFEVVRKRMAKAQKSKRPFHIKLHHSLFGVRYSIFKQV
ncbi:MAG: hypothetical protein CVT98_02810 [Bacteroidetes bacterium HGW-Bacteroidetes-15]|nr:MAG: hypothetical protein CVT98_02810 [Bacteroidetes bacterium HGW-Bacteroidetes-15]